MIPVVTVTRRGNNATGGTMIFFMILFFLPLLTSSTTFGSPTYDDLFPYYAEVCGLTRMVGGGPGGHAVIYLKGACLNHEAGYPQIRFCDPQKLETGTLLSIDRSFKNAEWVGIENREFAIHGLLKPEDPFDLSRLSLITRYAYHAHFFQGIQTYDNSKRIPADDHEYIVARQALGTDYAITLARKGSCWKIPVSVEQLGSMIQKANQLNSDHLDPKSPYRWNALGNNCSHFIINLLAAAHILKPIKTGAFFPANLFLNVPASSYQIAAPSTLMVKLGRKIKKKAIPSVVKAFRNKTIRVALQTYGRLPIQHGTILEVLKFHHHGNERFRLRNQRLGRPGDRNKLEKMEEDLDLQDLILNLTQYHTQYLNAEAELPSLEELQARHKKLRTSDFSTFFGQYSQWLKGSIQDTKEKLNQLQDG